MGNVQQGSPGPHLLKKVGSRHKITLPDDYNKLCHALTESSQGDGVGENISRRVFLKHFSCPKEGFGELAFEHCIRSQQNVADVHYITKDTFMKLCEQLFELNNDVNRLKYCLSIFSRGKDHLKKEGVEMFFTLAYYMASDVSADAEIYDVSTSPVAITFLDAVVASATKNAEVVTTDALVTWIKKNCMNLISGVHMWASKRMHEIPGNTDRKTKVLKNFPKSELQLNPFLLWLLTSSLSSDYKQRKQPVPSLQRMLSGQLDTHTYLSRLLTCVTPPQWILLYDCRTHGQSLNRFQNQVFCYRGPTVVLLELEERNVYCIGVDEEWRESSHRWGGQNCALIQVLPDYRVIETGEKLIYMNVCTRGHPLGIHVGATSKHPLLEIDEDLAIVHIKKIPYKLINIEVWGAAGEDIRAAQMEQKRWESREIEKHRKVKRDAVDWENHPDKFLLDLASSKTTGKYLSNCD